MRISYYNIGCKVNFADMSKLQELFESRGHTTVPYGDDADAVFINTCTVTNNADSDARKIIRKTRRKLPDAYIGVMGCYAQLKPNEIAAIEGVDGVFGTKEKFDIPDIIESYKKESDGCVYASDMTDLAFTSSTSLENKERTRVFMKLQDGCDYRCTYCTIPLARGKSRSMSFEKVKSEFEHVAAAGAKEVIISGINLAEYKADTGENFEDLIRLIDNFDLGMRVRISSLEPNKAKKSLVDVLKSSKNFCPHFHIPLQSGSAEILKMMKRRYSIDFFKEVILNIHESIEDVCIGNDVIVGFPGETEEHFKETYDLLESLPISYLHVFTYSERDNTPAAGFEGVVPMNIRKERTNKLRELSERKLDAFYDSQIGKEKVVLPESFNPDTGMWSGWTENYVRVVFRGAGILEKDFYKVRLTHRHGNKIFAEII